jgi:hypothetical protein
MTKTIDTLVDDIYELVDKGKDIRGKNLISMLDDISNSVREQFDPTTRNKTKTLRMSNIGKPECQIWHELHGTKGEELRPETRIKFLFGHIIEALTIFLVKEAGHTVTDEQKEVSIEGIKGHMDCKIDGVVVDVKSAATRAFQKFEKNTVADDDPFGYIAQLSSYAFAENQETAAFLAMGKEQGKLALAPMDSMDFIDPCERIKYLKEAMALDTPPERCYTDVEDGKSGNMKLNLNCSYCAFKEECWKDVNDGAGLRTFLYSNGPRYLTKVERLPDVFEKSKGD